MESVNNTIYDYWNLDVEIKSYAKKLERSPTMDSILLLKKHSLSSLLEMSESEAK